jgi:hypothetical protein
MILRFIRFREIGSRGSTSPRSLRCLRSRSPTGSFSHYGWTSASSPSIESRRLRLQTCYGLIAPTEMETIKNGNYQPVVRLNIVARSSTESLSFGAIPTGCTSHRRREWFLLRSKKRHLQVFSLHSRTLSISDEVIRTTAACITWRRGPSGLYVTSGELRITLRLCHTTSSTVCASERNLLSARKCDSSGLRLWTADRIEK